MKSRNYCEAHAEDRKPICLGIGNVSAGTMQEQILETKSKLTLWAEREDRSFFSHYGLYVELPYMSLSRQKAVLLMGQWNICIAVDNVFPL